MIYNLAGLALVGHINSDIIGRIEADVCAGHLECRVGYDECSRRGLDRNACCREIERELRRHGYTGFKARVCDDALEPIRISV